MLELTAVAEPFIHIFLTDKWLPCVPLLQGFCINYLFYPLHSANNQATKALGESRICFRVELIKKAITLIAVLICICFSTKAAVYGLALCSALGCIVDGYPNSLLIDYSLREQIRDFISPFVMSLVMAAAVYFLGWLPIGETLRLFIQVASGVIIYLFLSVITGNKEFRFICQNIRDLF
jgi:O-antigen/teichoic acid export membrane protein